jgi:hypothetical protein
MYKKWNCPLCNAPILKATHGPSGEPYTPGTLRDQLCYACQDRQDDLRLEADKQTVVPEPDPPAADRVTNPRHYNFSAIEVIDVIEAWFEFDRHGYHKGNIIKYVARAGHKDSELEDLKKAQWYLDRVIKQIEEGKTAV